MHGKILSVLVLTLAGLQGVPAQAPAPQKSSAPPQLEIIVDKNLSRRTTNYDDRMERLQFHVTVRNKDPKNEVQSLTAHLCVIGKQVASGNFEVLDKAQATFNLKPGGNHQFDGQERTFEFDEGDTARWGTKYDSFVIIIKDGAGKVVASRGEKLTFVKNADKLQEMNVGSIFDGKFKARKAP